MSLQTESQGQQCRHSYHTNKAPGMTQLMGRKPYLEQPSIETYQVKIIATPGCSPWPKESGITTVLSEFFPIQLYAVNGARELMAS